MNTPDTEEAKDRVNRMMQINDYLRNVYGLEDDSTLNAGEVEELCEMIVDHCLTSRDTYWKERVREAEPKDRHSSNFESEMYDRGYNHGKADYKRFIEKITNEDNLK